ncbi:MAG: hypothetical protein AB8F74_18945, partial [Saprospiraceae bacterium]
AIIFCFSSCINKEDPLGVDDEYSEEWAEFCDELEGGEIDLEIEGTDWSTTCAQAAYVESVTDEYSFRYVYIYSYNHLNTFRSSSEIEYVYLVWTEVEQNGEVERTATAIYYDAFFDYQRAINDPDYEIEDVNIFSSEHTNTTASNLMNISQIENDEVKGTVNFVLQKEDSPNETITITGSFKASLIE